MRAYAALVLLLALTVSASPSASASDLVLVHAKIYPAPDEQPVEDGTIVIHDGHITAVGPGAQTKAPRAGRSETIIDCQGRAVLAGFWNSHVHILTPGLLHAAETPAAKISSQLDQMLTRWGFTTVFDIASVLSNTNNIRHRIESGEVRGPRILTVGEPFYPKGGTPIYVKGFLEENHIPSAEVESESQAVKRVRQQIRDGADGIKIFAGAITAHGILPMPTDLAKSIIAEAHAAGKPVFAHPSNIEGIEISLASGVDILAHTTLQGDEWSPTLVQKLKNSHTALVPTLTLFDVEGRKGNVPREVIENVWMKHLTQEVRTFSDAGGQILFGTDVGYIDQFDTTEEFTLMGRAGMSFRQILASLTTSPASRFGYSKRSGRIAKGMEADIVVLEGDPEKDIIAFAKVRQVIRGGKVIYPAP